MDSMVLISRMLFSEFYKIVVNKDTFVRFRGAIALIARSGSVPVSTPVLIVKLAVS